MANTYKYILDNIANKLNGYSYFSIYIRPINRILLINYIKSATI